MALRKNRQFNNEWTSKFFVREVNNRPVCLICCATLSENKSTNVARHYNTNHKDYDGRFPPDTERRRSQLAKLQQQAQEQRNMLRAGLSPLQKRTTLASFQIANRLAQAMAPFQHGGLVKDCLTTTMKTLFPEKSDVNRVVEQIPPSRNTCTRSVEDMANELCNTTFSNLKRCEFFSVALDESNDIKDTAQLSIFARYYLDGEFCEDLLTVISLEGRTTGGIIFNEFQKFMQEHDLPLKKITSVATDGAPAMVGRHNGFIKHLRETNPDVIAVHCIIHESVLCSKLKDYSDIMKNAMKMINFLKSQSGLRHRQLRAFLEESEAEYNDLLTHNNVRWVYLLTIVTYMYLTYNTCLCCAFETCAHSSCLICSSRIFLCNLISSLFFNKVVK